MKKKFGFSLAEMMVVLLIVAVVLAATAPMITRRVARERSDKIFDMLNTDPTNAVEYIKGRNQRIYMDSRPNGYVGIRESGDKIPINSVIFGYNKYDTSAMPTDFVGIGFHTTNAKETIAIGYSAVSDDEGSIAIGTNAHVSQIKHGLFKGKAQHSTAIGYKSYIRASRSTALGYNASVAPGAKESTAIGYNAKAEHPNTIVLGTENDVVYIPGSLVVNHSALVGLASNRNDNLYFRPYAQEDGRHFAVLNAGDWKGEDSNVVMSQYALDTDYFGVEIGPYKTPLDKWKNDYKDNNRAHIHFTDPTQGDLNKTYKYSDMRLKDIGETFNSGLEELNKLKFYHFTFKNDKDKQPHVGVIAQDLEQVFPTSVKKDKDGWLQIRWDEMFYCAINAIKELNLKVVAISEKLQDFGKDITDLKAKTDKQQVEIETQAKIITAQQQELENLSLRIEKLEHKK